MTGTLREQPFAEIVGTLYQGKETGVLKVTAGGKVINIHFQDGNPVAAASDDPAYRISRILLDNEKIGLGEAEMLGGLPESKQAFETVEYISPDILLWGVKFRFLRLLEELFSWEDGEFDFTSEAVPPEALTLRVPTPFIIFTGTTKMPSQVFAHYGDEKIIEAASPIPTGQEGFFNPQRKALLEACTSGRQVGELLSAMPGDRERSRQTLYALSALGLVTLGEPEAPEPAPEPAAPVSPLETAEEPVLLVPEAEPPPAAPELPLETAPLEAPDEVSLEPDALRGLDGESELSLEAPVATEPEDELSLAPEPESPMPLDAAPELPLEIPSAEEPLNPEEEPPPLEAEEEIPPPPPGDDFASETGEGHAAIEADEGLSLSQTLGLGGQEEETESFQDVEAGEPAPAPQRRLLLPSSRAGKIAAVGGVLFILTGGLLMGLKAFRQEPAPTPPSTKSEVVETGEVTMEPAPVSLEEPATTPETETGGETVSVTEEKTAPSPEPASAVESPETPEVAPAAAVGEAAEAVAPAPDISPAMEASPQAEEAAAPASSAEALAAFRAGDIDGASRRWVEALREEPEGTFTLQVLMACEQKSLAESFPIFEVLGEVFVVPFQLGGKACYRVGLGTYPSIDAAKAALSDLSPEVRANGAVVKNLRQFLPNKKPSRSVAPVVAVPVVEAPPVLVPQEALPDYEEGASFFRDGDLSSAAKAWREVLRQEPAGTYTLQVLTACEQENVEKYFRLFEEHGKVYAVPVRMDGKACYRVGLETYPTKKAAQAALSELPAWVRDQRTVVKSLGFFVK